MTEENAQIVPVGAKFAPRESHERAMGFLARARLRPRVVFDLVQSFCGYFVDCGAQFFCILVAEMLCKCGMYAGRTGRVAVEFRCKRGIGRDTGRSFGLPCGGGRG